MRGKRRGGKKRSPVRICPSSTFACPIRRKRT